MTDLDPIRIGLTGSIGMGKSTTAAMFRDLGAEVWDADAAVARLYQKNAAGTVALQHLVPTAIDPEAGVDRDVLRALIAADPDLLNKIEKIIHPLVQQDRKSFAAATTTQTAVFDIPLLFETNAESEFDVIVVVTAQPGIQARRVLARPGMTKSRFDDILSRQMPDKEKQQRADFVIDTSNGLEDTKAQVQFVLQKILAERHA